MTLKWPETLIAIKDLKEYSRNPRRISKVMYEKLVKSLKNYGYHNRIKITQDNTIIGGHQRKKAFLDAGFRPTDKIPVLKASRILTDAEFRELNVQDNIPFGEFDYDMLTADNDYAELIEWGMPEDWLPSYEPPEEEKKPEEKEQKLVECPNCGHEF